MNIWEKLIEEAKHEVESAKNKELNKLIDSTGIAEAFCRVLSQRMGCSHSTMYDISSHIVHAYEHDPLLVFHLENDLQAILERDYACNNYLYPFLFYNGFHGLQLYRIAHYYLKNNEHFTASLIHERMVSVCSMDIHPAAAIGERVVIDHGLGVVIGETSVIGDDVFMYHNITLGGTGTGGIKRHPTIGNNVLIGSGTTLLGDITIGDDSAIAANSVVTKPIASGRLVAGNPAKEIGPAKAFQKKT